MIIRTTKELKDLTNNYYANNSFAKIESLIAEVSDEVARLISKEAMARIESYYDSEDVEERELLQAAQKPIAIMATLRLYQLNDLSHEDSGRKFKIDPDNERLPWQWQLDRDDELHIQQYYRALDKLFELLAERKVEEYINTDAYKLRSSLILQSGKQYSQYMPIDDSEHVYTMLVPFIREAQIRTIKPAYGDGWEELLGGDKTSDLYFAVAMATALLSMSMALRRLPLSLFPVGVIRKYMAENGSTSSRVPAMRDIDLVCDWLARDAREWVDQMKKLKNPSSEEYSLLPENDKNNKYFRL